MIKRITTFVVAVLFAMTLLAPAAFAQNARDCRDAGGTYDASTKTCSYPVGNSGKVKTETQENAGQGAQTGRTNPNNKSIPF